MPLASPCRKSPLHQNPLVGGPRSSLRLVTLALDLSPVPAFGTPSVFGPSFKTLSFRAPVKSLQRRNHSQHHVLPPSSTRKNCGTSPGVAWRRTDRRSRPAPSARRYPRSRLIHSQPQCQQTTPNRSRPVPVELLGNPLSNPLPESCDRSWWPLVSESQGVYSCQRSS